MNRARIVRAAVCSSTEGALVQCKYDRLTQPWRNVFALLLLTRNRRKSRRPHRRLRIYRSPIKRIPHVLRICSCRLRRRSCFRSSIPVANFGCASKLLPMSRHTLRLRVHLLGRSALSVTLGDSVARICATFASCALSGHMATSGTRRRHRTNNDGSSLTASRFRRRLLNISISPKSAPSRQASPYQKSWRNYFVS